MDDERVHVVLKLRKICRSAPRLVVSKVRVAPCEPLEVLIKSCGIGQRETRPRLELGK